MDENLSEGSVLPTRKEGCGSKRWKGVLQCSRQKSHCEVEEKERKRKDTEQIISDALFNIRTLLEL